MWLSEPLWLSELKNLPTVQETQVQSLGQEDPLEDSMAAHSSILAWRITWTEEPGGLRSMGLQRVRCDWALKHTHSWFTMLCWFQASSTVIQLHIKKKKIHAFSIKVITEYWVEFPVLYSMCLLITYFIFSSVYNTLAWKIPWMGEPDGLPSMGSHRVGHNWGDLAAAAVCIKWNWKSLSHVQLFVIPWTVACQVPLFVDFCRPEYWSG